MVLSKKNLTIVAKKINHYAFFFVLPASFSMVWHVYNKQRVNIKIRKCVNLFIYLFNKREAEKGRIVKPLLEFLSFACTKMNASFRLKISIHPRLLSFHEFRDPSISKVSVKRHSPTRCWNVLSTPRTQRKASDVTAHLHVRILFLSVLLPCP